MNEPNPTSLPPPAPRRRPPPSAPALGPRMKWLLAVSLFAAAWLAATAAFVVGMIVLHGVDPRQFTQVAPKEGELYFHPSEARTENGKFIPARALMMDEYCKKCHADIYNDHFHSARKFSSFNN